MINKKKLAIKLSRLKPLKEFDVSLEQYQIESELAAGILWLAYMNNDIENKVIADIGCGNGVLGCGALMLGARKVYFIDKDKKAISIAKGNCNYNNSVFLNIDTEKFNEKVDTVVMNPPFGVQNRKADKIFLLAAMDNANSVYSIHKIESKDFIEKLCKENGFKVNDILKVNFLLKKTYIFHKKPKYFVKAGVWSIRKV